MRAQIISQLKEYLVANTSAWSATPGYIEDVNDFPSVSIFIPRETLYHLSASGASPNGTIIKSFTFQIRGYVFSDEDSLEDSETLAYEIEQSLPAFSNYYTGTLLDIRVTSLSTDEGLLSPYGVCDLEIWISYSDLC